MDPGVVAHRTGASGDERPHRLPAVAALRAAPRPTSGRAGKIIRPKLMRRLRVVAFDYITTT